MHYAHKNIFMLNENFLIQTVKAIKATKKDEKKNFRQNNLFNALKSIFLLQHSNFRK